MLILPILLDVITVHEGEIPIISISRRYTLKMKYLFHVLLITILNLFLYQFHYPMICVQLCMGNS